MLPKFYSFVNRLQAAADAFVQAGLVKQRDVNKAMTDTVEWAAL